uniref:Uncharacterized protein n=1 Tax=Aegilops tauschii subsp. strangulata TaxID=200361 RepID=A0A452YWR2_AEGTS
MLMEGKSIIICLHDCCTIDLSHVCSTNGKRHIHSCLLPVGSGQSKVASKQAGELSTPIRYLQLVSRQLSQQQARVAN